MFAVVLASILQPPVFNPEWPSYATFGGIGFIIGHEIMHAYNPLSVSNKIPGVMTGWLDDTKKDVFSNRTDCLVHQYNAYTDEQTEERVMDFWKSITNSQTFIFEWPFLFLYTKHVLKNCQDRDKLAM